MKHACHNRKYHFIYKTVNLSNDTYYIGMHSTNDLQDGYLGSGKRLKYAIKKYGREQFTLNIIEFCNSRDELAAREKELINAVVLADPTCLNLKSGGKGGFIDDSHAYKFHAAGGRAVRLILSKRHHFKMKHDAEYRQKVCDKMKGKQPWLGKKHSDETKLKMSLKKIGRGIGAANSQFGKMWITNGSINKKINKIDVIPEGYYPGRFLNKNY